MTGKEVELDIVNDIFDGAHSGFEELFDRNVRESVERGHRQRQ